MAKQIFNPYLPLNEYIPDGEPHVFGDRVYIFGSHDREGGYTFCMEDYVTYSAPVDDLTDWRYEGVIYKADQDPLYGGPAYGDVLSGNDRTAISSGLKNQEDKIDTLKYMYAPDVVQGNDGKYYLYYCMGGDYGYGGYSGYISVAVADTPVGPYEYLGFVKNADGSPMMKYIPFDPAVINDNGTIRLYYGTQYGYEEEEDFMTNGRLEDEVQMFGRTREEILYYMENEGSINGPVMAVLNDDMLTVKEEARHIIPAYVKGTSFEEHPFFEAASMRKVGEKYYFVYSSWENHELCYATSDYPDRDFTFGGTIVSNGDVGYNGRKTEDKLNMTGTTHGSIVRIKDDWYVFFHRLTHKSDYSRQSMAEKIEIAEDGSIAQVEVTSCGLNGGPLASEGSYSAPIACNISNGHMPHGSNSVYTIEFPNVTNLGDDRFIAEIEKGTLIAFKYFDCKSVKRIGVKVRVESAANKVVYDGPVRVDERSGETLIEAQNKKKLQAKDKQSNDSLKEVVSDNDHNTLKIEVRLDYDGEVVGIIEIPNVDTGLEWVETFADVNIPDGVHGIFLTYVGDDISDTKIQMKELLF